jgi:hypothetical protein
MKKRKIKWVNSYRDIPRWQERGLTSSLHGFHERSTDTVYLIKGKSSKADEQHEIYHGIKKHPGMPIIRLDSHNIFWGKCVAFITR